MSAKEWLRRDPENGMLIGPDDCQYANEHKAAHFCLLGLCGCGSPEDAYNFCRDALALFDRRDIGGKRREWINAEEALRALILQRPGDAAHVIAHWLDHLGLTDHGSNVGGSWLTDNGARIVDMGPMTEELMDEGR